MGRAILNWLPWHRDANVLADEETDRLDVGSVLVEISDRLPAHMYAHWRVEKRFKGPGDKTACFAASNMSGPHAHKLLAVSSLNSARRFQLMDNVAH